MPDTNEVTKLNEELYAWYNNNVEWDVLFKKLIPEFRREAEDLIKWFKGNRVKGIVPSEKAYNKIINEVNKLFNKTAKQLKLLFDDLKITKISESEHRLKLDETMSIQINKMLLKLLNLTKDFKFKIYKFVKDYEKEVGGLKYHNIHFEAWGGLRYILPKVIKEIEKMSALEIKEYRLARAAISRFETMGIHRLDAKLKWFYKHINIDEGPLAGPWNFMDGDHKETIENVPGKRKQLVSIYNKLRAWRIELGDEVAKQLKLIYKELKTENPRLLKINLREGNKVRALLKEGIALANEYISVAQSVDKYAAQIYERLVREIEELLRIEVMEYKFIKSEI